MPPKGKHLTCNDDLLPHESLPSATHEMEEVYTRPLMGFCSAEGGLTLGGRGSLLSVDMD